LGSDLIFAVLFRATKFIYWSIGLHIVYNGIGLYILLSIIKTKELTS